MDRARRQVEGKPNRTLKKEHYEQRHRHSIGGHRYNIDRLWFQCVRLGKFGHFAILHWGTHKQSLVVAAGRHRQHHCWRSDDIASFGQSLNESRKGIHANCKFTVRAAMKQSCSRARPHKNPANSVESRVAHTKLKDLERRFCVLRNAITNRKLRKL